MTQVIKLKDLTIPNGTAVSPTVDAASDYASLGYIYTLFAPAAFGAETYTLEGSYDNVTFNTLTQPDGAASLTLPGAAKAKSYYFELNSIPYWRIRSSINVVADRIWKAAMQEWP